MLNNIIRSVYRISIMTMISVALGFLLAYTMHVHAYPAYKSSMGRSLTKVVKKSAPYIRPLTNAMGARYCSSSSIKYKGVAFTVTNNHCCEYGLTLFGKNEVRVGNTIEKLIYQSPYADVCILTSSQKKTPLRLAKKEFRYLDEAILIGYPRGENLTPRYGHLLSTNSNVCIGFICRPSNFISTIGYPGNSGSPVLDNKGRVVNIMYAGDMLLHTYSITVPHFFLKHAIKEARKLVKR